MLTAALAPDLELACALLRQDRLIEADQAFTAQMREAPGSVEAVVGLAQVARRRNHLADALIYFGQAAAMAPHRPGLRAETGHTLLALDQVDEAEAVFQAVLEDHPREAGALIGLGHVAGRRGDSHEALRHLRAAAEVVPNHLGLKTTIAHHLVLLGLHQDAEVWLQEAHALAPADVSVLTALAHAARLRGDRATSLERFELAAQLEPNRAGLLAEAAHDLVVLGQTAAGKARFEAVLAIDPRETGALIGLGQLASGRGDHRAAIAWFEQAAASAPGHSGVRKAIGHAAVQLGWLDMAQEQLQQALALDPRDVGTLASLATVHNRRGDAAGALCWFEAASKIAPANPEFALGAAECLLELGRAEEARTAFAAVLDRSPRLVRASLGLVRTARQLGDHYEARRLLLEAVERAEDSPDIKLTVAEALIETGDPEAARRILSALLEADPDNFAALMLMGTLDRQHGDRTSALAWFRRAAALQPDRAAPLVGIATEQWALGLPEQSEQSLHGALVLESGNIDGLLNLAEHAGLAGDPRQQLLLAERAMAAHPLHAAPVLQAAAALRELGRGAEAGFQLANATRRLGALPELLAMMAELAWHLGDWAAARAALDYAGGEIARSLPLWMQHLRLCLTLGDFARAEAALLDAPAWTSAEHALVWLFRGQLAEAQWRLTDAEACYLESARLNPNNAGVEADLARVCLTLFKLDRAWQHQDRSLQLMASASQGRGHSSRVSQSHVGHIGNELRLDAELSQRLRGLMHQAPPARLAWLRPLLGFAADTLSVALAWLVTLRQSGRFAWVAGEGQSIPRRITQFWDSAEPPRDVAALMASWPRCNPLYEYRRFDNISARRWLAGSAPEGVLEAYDRSDHPAQKADLLRLAVLAVDGGIWADADDLCVAEVSPLLAGPAEFVTYQEIYGTLGNNVIAAVPEQPVIVRALELATAALLAGDTDIAWLSTGPGLLSRAFVDVMGREELVPEAFLTACRVVERGELAGFVACHRAAGYKRTNLHWLRRSLAGGSKR
jgi:tetratricopeptide (TPR) repeat protein